MNKSVPILIGLGLVLLATLFTHWSYTQANPVTVPFGHLSVYDANGHFLGPLLGLAPSNGAYDEYAIEVGTTTGTLTLKQVPAYNDGNLPIANITVINQGNIYFTKPDCDISSIAYLAGPTDFNMVNLGPNNTGWIIDPSQPATSTSNLLSAYYGDQGSCNNGHYDVNPAFILKRTSMSFTLPLQGPLQIR